MTTREKAEATLTGWEIAEMFGQDDVQEVPTSDIKDMVDVSAAYLAEHPADDDEAVDDVWLRSIGFKREMQPAADNHVTLRSGAFHVTCWRNRRLSGDTWSCQNEWLPESAQPKTRGAVRALLKALGIPTT